MNVKEMEKLTKHFETCFAQSDCIVLHNGEMKPHIDGLLFRPTEKYPFWKLTTMGASDCKMPAPKHALGNRNEYMMFIAPEENLEDRAVLGWYLETLMEVALYPFHSGKFLTYGHSVEWAPEEGEEMTGAFLELPMAIENVGILRCKLGLLKEAVCLQVIPLNREETDKLLTIGPEAFSEFLYPEEGKCHFLAQRNRTEAF